jgi:histidine triad (HIT) family protein
MQDSIFTKIINGEIPSHKIYEDDHIFAFLDIHPLSEGHTLVVPKKQVEFVWDLDNETYQALMEVCKKLAVRFRQVLDVPYVGEKIVGIDVAHAHVHLIPFTDVRDYHQPGNMNSEPDHVALAALAEKLKTS